MRDFIRRIKVVYMIYNFFHRKELIHNEIIYKKLGINKKYYSPISSGDFESLNFELEAKNPEKRIQDCELFSILSNEDQKSLLAYEQEGFAVLKNYVKNDHVDEINAQVEMGLQNGTLKFENKNKIMFAIHSISALSKLGNDNNLLELLEVLFKGNPILFQSINFLTGSEQHTHSDSIHMTTFPLGGLLGVWVALEDIHEDNGPLHYYPKSHLLPYYLNKDYNNTGSSFMLGDKDYDAYENFIAKKMKETGLEKVNFLAKKGDVLLWHANLFHGGNEHINKLKTRKSVVFHYFKENSVCYHEITQRPALIKKGI